MDVSRLIGALLATLMAGWIWCHAARMAVQQERMARRLPRAMRAIAVPGPVLPRLIAVWSAVGAVLLVVTAFES